MKNITIGIDYLEVKKEVYAESACVALMTGGNRPQIITEDNEKLVNLYIDSAIVETVGCFIGFVGKGVDFEGNSIKQIPLCVSDDISAALLRRQVERTVAAKTLELIYSGNERLSLEYKRRFAGLVAQTKQILASSSVML